MVAPFVEKWILKKDQIFRRKLESKIFLYFVVLARQSIEIRRN